MKGYLERLIFLRNYFNGDEPITIFMDYKQVVEVLDAIIKDLT